MTTRIDSQKVTTVRLELHASKLKNVAGWFKGTSDPYAVLFLLPASKTEKVKVLGQTEVVKNSLSPRWVTYFDFDYELGSVLRFSVGIFDEIRKAQTNKPMGSATFEVGEILGARGNLKAKRLKSGGIVFARLSSPPFQQAGTLNVNLRGIDLRNENGLFGKSSPFLEISSRINVVGGPSWQLVHRSERVTNDQNPRWPQVSVDVNRLCGGNRKKPIMIAVYDWKKNGKHKSMGSFETTLHALLNANNPDAASQSPEDVSLDKAFTLQRKFTTCGQVVVCDCEVEGATPYVPQHSSSTLPAPILPPLPATSRPLFVDYLAGGCKLNLSIAIDFSGSNGNPRKPGTLHYIRPNGELNDYEKCLTSVGSIIGKYDSDQKFPVYGFGAKYGGVLNNCFQIGGKSELSGLHEVLSAYRQVFSTGLTMSGPSDLSLVIDRAAGHARQSQAAAAKKNEQSYEILLIVTNGAIKNIDESVSALERASDAPLSVVVVGVGNADFSKLQHLDDFAIHGRDICQFVEFERFKHDKSALTRETLDEIPDQLVDYFYGRGIMPLPAQKTSASDVIPEDLTEADVDFSIEFNSEGEIGLSSRYDKLTYDETKYDTAASYDITPSRNDTAFSLVLDPSDASTRSVGTDKSLSIRMMENPIPPPFFSSNSIFDIQLPPPKTDDGVFYVQVPTGMVAGQQLNVVNPHNQSVVLVTIPDAPNGVFAVHS